MNEEIIGQGQQKEVPILTSRQILDITKQMPIIVDGNVLTLIGGIGNGTVQFPDEAESLPGIRLSYTDGRYLLILASKEILLDLATRMLDLAKTLNEEVLTIDMPTEQEQEPVLTMEDKEDDTVIP